MAAKPKTVERTHVGRVMFPEVGVTKGEVLDYYEQVAPLLLPYLENRPVTLERMPYGMNGPLFWQKNTPAHYPGWIKRIRLPTLGNKSVQYVLVNDVQTLLYLANQGAITFHPFTSRIDRLECPDFVVFDLDLGSGPFSDAVRIALSLHALLTKEGFEATVKTSGKTGLHVTTGWSGCSHDEARAWALSVAENVVRQLPKIATVERVIAKRKGRVYLDVIQNAKGHHLVPPYVLRATPRALVSTPLEWDELTPKLDPASFDLRAMLKRLGQGRKARKKAA